MFRSREYAGKVLANELKDVHADLILGIPRGGVVVAKVISEKLFLPLDIVVVKKLGSPFNSELAIGAVGPEKTVYWDEELCRNLGISWEERNQELRVKNQERRQREKMLRENKKTPVLKNKSVILVDDGIATGATVLVAVKYLRKKQVKELILAVPVISSDTYREIAKYFDRTFVLEVSSEFQAVGQFYSEFSQVSDSFVKKLLYSR